MHSCPATLTFQTSKHSQSCNYHEGGGNCTPSEKRPWRIMCGKDDVTPASERAVYALPPCYYFLMAITTRDNKHDQRTLQRQRQIGNWDAFSAFATAARSSHYVSGFVSKPPADGFHPEMFIPTWLIFRYLRPVSSVVLVRKRPLRIKFHIGKECVRVSSCG